MIKERISDAFSGINSALIDNSDGDAKNRRYRLLYTWLATAITTIVTGSYLTGLMLEMGAEDHYISTVSALTALMGGAQLIAPMIFERLTVRKNLLITLRLVYHLLNVLVIGIIPILPINKPLMLTLFMAVIVLLNLINSISTPGISIWQMQCVPPVKQSNYFTVSNLGAQLISTASGLIAGGVVDSFKSGMFSTSGVSATMFGFLVLRAAALIFAIGEIFCMMKMDEREYGTDTEPRLKSIGALLEPLRNKSFVKIMTIYIFYNFVSGIVGQYFSVYLLTIANVSYSFLSYSNLLSMPFVFIATPIWNRLTNKYSWSKILPMVIFGAGVAYVFNMFITAQTQYFHFIVMILFNIFYPSILIIYAYLPYVNMPKHNRTSYISLFTTSGLVFSFLGTLFGMLFMTLTEGIGINLFGWNMINYQYINLLQFVLFALLAVYAHFVCKDYEKNKV